MNRAAAPTLMLALLLLLGCSSSRPQAGVDPCQVDPNSSHCIELELLRDRIDELVARKKIARRKLLERQRRFEEMRSEWYRTRRLLR